MVSVSLHLGLAPKLIFLPEHSSLQIPMTQGKPVQGVKDLFAVLIMVKYLLNDPDFFEKMKVEIAQSLDNLQGQLLCITLDEVMSMMGFPSNWQLV